MTCQSNSDNQANDNAPPVVDVTAVDYAYRHVPDSIPSGWTTFRMHNEGQKTHHLELLQLPEGTDPQGHREAVAISREFWPKVEAGEIDTAEFQERFPSWPDSAEAVGGLEPLAPGRTASITTRLEPDTHVMTCYVSTPEETNHWEIGMDRAFTVTSDSTSLRLALLIGPHNFLP